MADKKRWRCVRDIIPDIIENKYIDAICIGDGEMPLKTFLDRLDNDEEYWNTGSFYVKYKQDIYKNDIMPLLQNIASRGCPFKCSFCMNERYHELYREKGKIYRKKTIDTLMRELKEALELMPNVTRVFFADDLFLSDREYLRQFAPRFKREINLPYLVNGFPFYIDDEIGKLLKSSGCTVFGVGVETGNEDKRIKIFNKKIKNSDFIRMSEVLRENRIQIYTANIFNYPAETFQDALKTVELNLDMRTAYPAKSLLLPYPNTKIADIAKQMNLIPKDFGFDDIPKSYYLETVIESPEKNKILRIYNYFYFLSKHRCFFILVKNYPWILIIIPFPRFWNYLGMYLWFKNWKGFSYMRAFLYLWRFRKNR